MLYHLLSLSNETTTSPSTSSPSSSSSSRDSYVVGAIVGGILGLLILVGIGLIAYFRCIVLPQTRTQKDRDIRNHSGTWDDDEEEFDSFRPSLIISTWVGRVVSHRYSISRQPIKSDMEVYTPDHNNDNDDTEQPSSSVINQRSGSIFQTSSSSESILRDSTGHNNNTSPKSIQESISVRESGQNSNSNSNNNNSSSSSSSSSGGGLSVLRTSPLGRSPVVLARSMDSSRRRANTGAPSSSSPIKVIISMLLLL